MKRTVGRLHLCRNNTAGRWSPPSTWHTQQTASSACQGGGWPGPGCVSGRLPRSSPPQPSPWWRGKPPRGSPGSGEPSPTGWWSAGLALRWLAGARWTQCSLGERVERGQTRLDTVLEKAAHDMLSVCFVGSPSCSLVLRVLKQGSEMIWQNSSSSMLSWVVCMSVW